MAFIGLLRSAACRGIACQTQSLQTLSRTSLISPQILKSSFTNHTLPGFSRLQPGRINQVQFFSLSPKSYSAGAGHNHSKLWTIERALSAVLILVVPAALAAPSKALDTVLAVTLVMHSHWGVEAAVVDYVRPIIFGNAFPKVALGGVYVLSIVTLAGLLQIIYTDIGLANTVKKIWSL
ncbi:succinate dehydrogenase [ubiquinone] cytochrome b small subunit, mitochondrial [Frankliniella occidentalis]|uniref:Succinate dehydrogenase [ubiquinone] cytochrome b small subunit n=1 Tax=Frankliniella occidentalis TaxID=133901 RepID=A0A6J1S4Z5_FRAOC|nr:succinate dehydrogenase [ubiquinone] cytochrome b small subunit, mitochondrial [Frankliniella occidentalis]